MNPSAGVSSPDFGWPAGTSEALAGSVITPPSRTQISLHVRSLPYHHDDVSDPLHIHYPALAQLPGLGDPAKTPVLLFARDHLIVRCLAFKRRVEDRGGYQVQQAHLNQQNCRNLKEIQKRVVFEPPARHWRMMAAENDLLIQTYNCHISFTILLAREPKQYV